ncbi:MAG: 4-(cytidine 5'-diphospho)-2-C-methyl-D-erythritol kinase [Treponema sp.]|jgi:4-diphosphocytidyl-2-C-methyl-D-erythritol kinase|nr:4-(cytidine 5'-diphospho)-2-C-methyl-D-erythritol kinase [Treponema sp.]
MLATVHVSAPAKVNLHLRVLPKRTDALHGIESIFQTVNLFDEFNVCKTAEPGSCIVDCSTMTLPGVNTFTETYKAYCALTGFRAGIRVALTKRIPAGGGLGGGSSDAAAFLYSLDVLNGTSLSMKQAVAIAGEVGSDVFFFLHCRNSTSVCAVVTGRGEKVRLIKPRTDLHFVLVFPGVYCSTAECYGLLDRRTVSGETEVFPALEELETVYNGPVTNWRFRNSFTSVIVQKYPVIGLAADDLRKAGAVFTEMSGSGSTVYGVFETFEEAQKAQKKLAQRWENCVVA